MLETNPGYSNSRACALDHCTARNIENNVPPGDEKEKTQRGGNCSFQIPGRQSDELKRPQGQRDEKCP